jgi:hypothetical protein
VTGSSPTLSLATRTRPAHSDASLSSTRAIIRQGPPAYRMFRDKQDECLKVVLKP